MIFICKFISTVINNSEFLSMTPLAIHTTVDQGIIQQFSSCPVVVCDWVTYWVTVSSYRHPLRVVCVLSNSFSLSKLSWTILFILYYVHYSIRKAQPTACCSFTSQPCSVLFSSSTLPTFMVTKKVFGLCSKLVKHSVWQNFLLSRIHDAEVFQKSLQHPFFAELCCW